MSFRICPTKSRSARIRSCPLSHSDGGPEVLSLTEPTPEAETSAESELPVVIRIGKYGISLCLASLLIGGAAAKIIQAVVPGIKGNGIPNWLWPILITIWTPGIVGFVLSLYPNCGCLCSSVVSCCSASLAGSFRCPIQKHQMLPNRDTPQLCSFLAGSIALASDAVRVDNERVSKRVSRPTARKQTVRDSTLSAQSCRPEPAQPCSGTIEPSRTECQNSVVDACCSRPTACCRTAT